MRTLFGEIGTANKKDAAALMKAGGFTKPAATDVSGRYARAGMRFGHTVVGDKVYGGKREQKFRVSGFGLRRSASYSTHGD